MPAHKRYFTALVKVKGYKRLFELPGMICNGDLSQAREIVQEHFSFYFDGGMYVKIPLGYEPPRKDIKIVWEEPSGVAKVRGLNPSKEFNRV